VVRAIFAWPSTRSAEVFGIIPVDTTVAVLFISGLGAKHPGGALGALPLYQGLQYDNAACTGFMVIL